MQISTRHSGWIARKYLSGRSALSKRSISGALNWEQQKPRRKSDGGTLKIASHDSTPLHQRVAYVATKRKKPRAFCMYHALEVHHSTELTSSTIQQPGKQATERRAEKNLPADGLLPDLTSNIDRTPMCQEVVVKKEPQISEPVTCCLSRILQSLCQDLTVPLYAEKESGAEIARGVTAAELKTLVQRRRTAWPSKYYLQYCRQK